LKTECFPRPIQRKRSSSLKASDRNTAQLWSILDISIGASTSIDRAACNVRFIVDSDSVIACPEIEIGGTDGTSLDFHEIIAISHPYNCIFSEIRILQSKPIPARVVTEIQYGLIDDRAIE
jgi:hypothetical protein